MYLNKWSITNTGFMNLFIPSSKEHNLFSNLCCYGLGLVIGCHYGHVAKQ